MQYTGYVVTLKFCLLCALSNLARMHVGFYMLSPVRLSVCRLSVVCRPNVRAPTQAVEIFRNVSTALGTLAIH